MDRLTACGSAWIGLLGQVDCGHPGLPIFGSPIAALKAARIGALKMRSVNKSTNNIQFGLISQRRGSFGGEAAASLHPVAEQPVFVEYDSICKPAVQRPRNGLWLSGRFNNRKGASRTTAALSA